jgi:membrane associated rhomboid family serine protease
MTNTDAPPPAAPEQSEQEAPPPRREPVFNLPRVVMFFIAVCLGIYVLQFHVLTMAQDYAVLIRGAFIPIRYSGAVPIDIYTFTSPVTYSLLHGSFAHLAVNMVWLGAFGSPLANRLGTARFVLFWVAASIAAVALHYVLHMQDQSPLVGASGAISGMMGAAARFGFRIDRSSGRAAFGGPVLPVRVVLMSRGVVTFLTVWMVINLITGLVGLVPGETSQIAWEAHIGGFLLGFFGISAFDRDRRRMAA